jgi:tetratricopeptide (TPR) repeat protein
MKAVTVLILALAIAVFAQEQSPTANQAAAPAKQQNKPDIAAPPPMTAEQVVSFLEGQLGWEERQTDSDSPTYADVIRVVSELRARLKAKPQDIQALLLWAHFALIPEPLQLPAEAQPPASEPESLPPPGVALDRVLAAQPHNAEALFLKGRITLASDPGKALVLLRQALEFAPGNPKYGVFLAQILAEQGRPGEAAQILRSAQKNHPAIPFLEDLETLGTPEGGELAEGCGWCAFPMRDLLSNAHLEDLWLLRMRFYHYLKSPAEIEAFYSNRIPGFRFIEEKEMNQGTPGSGDKRDQLYAQFVQVKSGSMKPVSKASELREFIGTKDGIYILLLEIHDDPDLKRKLLPGEHSCYLILTNLRK